MAPAPHFFVARRGAEAPEPCRHVDCGRAQDDPVHLVPTSDVAAITFFGWYVREPHEREALGLHGGLVAERPMTDRAARRRERTSEWRREFHAKRAEQVRAEAARQAREDVRRRRRPAS